MTTNYSDEFLATLDPEVRALAEEQAREDTSSVDQERLGGDRVVSLDALNLDESVGAYDNTADVVDGPPKETVSPLTGIVQDVLASLPPHLAETYALVYMDRKTLREAGDDLGIAFTSVRSRLQTIYSLVGKAVIAAGELEA